MIVKRSDTTASAFSQSIIRRSQPDVLATFEGQKQKVHSLVDKVYSRKNLKLAWERVRANQGAGGTDGVTIGEFEADLDANLERLHRELREKTYRPQAVRRLVPLSAMPEADAELACLLTQRTFRSLRKLHNLSYRCLRFRMGS